jgi:hypothetical protein
MAVAFVVTAPACGGANDRWVVTENSAIDIDWDAVGQAYREAEGPEDLERRVNEIYAGDEVISISVKDTDASTQQVTGFFDNNEDGKVQDDEKIFSIDRTLESADKAQYQIAGYGPYAGYHSPMWDIAAGMVMGSMLSRMFMPGYSPMYLTPYSTPATRRGDLMTQRNSYRAANPEKYQAARSKSGRSYGAKGGGFGGGRSTPAPRAPSRGGGRFGSRSAPRHAVTRL